MRKLIQAFFLFISMTSVVAQPRHTPPSFIIDYSAPGTPNYFLPQTMPRDSLVNNYSFSIDVFDKGDIIRFAKKSSIKNQSPHIEYYLGKRRHKRKIAYTRLFFEDFWRFGRFVPKGSLFGLSLKHKKTKQVMNIFVRLGEPLSTRFLNSINIYRLEFKQGNFFYDLCDCKYAVKLTHPPIISLGTLKNHAIKLNELQALLAHQDCTPQRFVIDLSTSVIKKEPFLRNYDVLAARLEYQNWIYHYRRKKSLNPSFLKWAIKQHPSLVKYPYLPLTKDGTIVRISFINDQKQAMNLYFKIYKHYEDYNRNEITLTHFKFVEGNFFCDMENYPVDDCSKPRFIDEFDLIQITKYAISKQKLEQILKSE